MGRFRCRVRLGELVLADFSFARLFWVQLQGTTLSSVGLLSASAESSCLWTAGVEVRLREMRQLSTVGESTFPSGVLLPKLTKKYWHLWYSIYWSKSYVWIRKTNEARYCPCFLVNAMASNREMVSSMCNYRKSLSFCFNVTDRLLGFILVFCFCKKHPKGLPLGCPNLAILMYDKIKSSRCRMLGLYVIRGVWWLLEQS